MNHDDARRLALGLPEATEQDHHGFPSFRVHGKIFATLPDEGFLHVMLDPERIREVVLLDPASCAEKWWGEKLAAVRVDLEAIDPDALRDLIAEGWRAKAPKGGQKP